MSWLRLLVWPVLVGALGGFVALEGSLSCDVAGEPHDAGRMMTDEVRLWLFLGFVGPWFVLVLERLTVLRKCALTPM
jgi:hypothetical protein